MNPTVDDFLSRVEKWQEELAHLRMIILECGLTEEVKWGVPCYTFEQTNLIGINGLKECCVLAFFSGVLLNDDNHILLKPGPNTKAGRWIKFTSVRQIVNMEPILKAYIYETIELKRAGIKAHFKKDPHSIPAELKKKFKEVDWLKKAFEALTPGRQRAYILYFLQPKQPKTRESRIDKCLKLTMNGQGLNDNYYQREK
jgi:uncharacterized protein YdeI (YjbR/CyaY-like superfamily)